MIHLLISVQPKTKWMAMMKMRLFKWNYIYIAGSKVMPSQ